MQVFVTGASGYIGAAVIKALVKAGHQAAGLVRSVEAEAALKLLGARPVWGDLKDPAVYASVAGEHDAIVHIGFQSGPEGVTVDRRAVGALLEAARGGGRTRSLIYTSGVLVLGNTGDRPAYEVGSTEGAIPMVAWRPAHEQLVLNAASEVLATAVIRPGFVYGGKKGLIADYFAGATKHGAAVYVGDGKNRIALVHRDDLAELYRLVIEKHARGVFHGVDGGSSRTAELARVASEAAGKGGTRSMPLEEARKKMGPFADALCVDQVVGIRRYSEVGWKPTHLPFIESAGQAYDEWRDATH